MTDTKHLVEPVKKILRKAGFTEENIATVVNSYQYYWRTYHSLEHLMDMYQYVTDDNTDLVVAIALHDVFYLSTPVQLGYNEYISANMVLQYYPKCNYTQLQEIQKAIIATGYYYITQAKNNLSELAQLLCDYDISNFALPYEKMCYFSNLALDEAKRLYSSVPPNSEMFIRGQIIFFKKMLERSQLYYIHTQWEQPARENIIRRLDELRNMLSTQILSEQGCWQEQ